MKNNQIIEATKTFVKTTLKDAEGGHDWFHTERVYKNALLISKGETVDELVVALGALLHDIADSKFNNGDDTIGPKIAGEFLMKQNVSTKVINHVIKIIENVSFSSNIDKTDAFKSKELEVIQDADRLDALGAIGIARTFNYGGFKNRALYNPDIKPNLNLTKDEYKASTAPSINHFYEKLLLLKDKMNTKTGRKIAEERHNYMVDFLKQFYAEWHGEK
ncbi:MULTISPECIES: HD domain-containing protein [Mesoflavibacter]|uniref:HD domain-containing protein n=1 Tax=Mesoflavibacter profundi TaxID=2708110 RepID=A0ABT4S239_9FLAO|nr:MULTISPECIES: HD domain-containing protein [Mesoflavibacter]MDA0177820.1 HD domain-containing protein [Mesoflavibacter profundi]QIJ88780.1 HD domain protein [Mesoflavibacter sp. HG96]QIJ91508.1 HD domain protein [Mesoflavibacter sp. HG37]